MSEFSAPHPAGRYAHFLWIITGQFLLMTLQDVCPTHYSQQCPMVSCPLIYLPYSSLLLCLFYSSSLYSFQLLIISHLVYNKSCSDFYRVDSRDAFSVLVFSFFYRNRFVDRRLDFYFAYVIVLVFIAPSLDSLLSGNGFYSSGVKKCACLYDSVWLVWCSWYVGKSCFSLVGQRTRCNSVPRRGPVGSYRADDVQASVIHVQNGPGPRDTCHQGPHTEKKRSLFEAPAYLQSANWVAIRGSAQGNHRAGSLVEALHFF